MKAIIFGLQLDLIKIDFKSLMKQLYKKKILETIDKKEGFLKTKLFSNNDVNILSSIVKKNLNSVVSKNSNFNKLNINFFNYINKSIYFDHSKILNRQNRLFKSNDIKSFFHLVGYKKLKEIFGDFEVTNEVQNEIPEIVWRIVRPNQTNDAAGFHTDQWFFDLNEWDIKKGNRLIKIWTLLHGLRNDYGLNVVTFSNLSEEKNYTTIDDFIKKPRIINEPNPQEIKLVKTFPGETILFNYNLLHSGSKAKENEIRVSFEFTISIKN